MRAVVTNMKWYVILCHLLARYMHFYHTNNENKFTTCSMRYVQHRLLTWLIFHSNCNGCFQVHCRYGTQNSRIISQIDCSVAHSSVR